MCSDDKHRITARTVHTTSKNSPHHQPCSQMHHHLICEARVIVTSTSSTCRQEFPSNWRMVNKKTLSSSSSSLSLVGDVKVVRHHAKNPAATLDAGNGLGMINIESFLHTPMVKSSFVRFQVLSSHFHGNLSRLLSRTSFIDLANGKQHVCLWLDTILHRDTNLAIFNTVQKSEL